MRKRLWIIPVLLLGFVHFPADAYTVIMKNGKVMKGTLVSESEAGIVFKDEKGLQFSLNKSALDVGKMKEANAAPAPAAAPATKPPSTTPAPAAKKPARVYTAADLQTIRDKVRLSGSTENGGEMVDPSSPAGYYKGLMEAVSRISGVQNDLVGLLDGMNTDWEVASSTGRNPVDSLQKYKGGKAYADITASIKSNLAELQSLRDSMQPPLQQYRNAFDAMNTCVDTLYEYFTTVAQYSGNPPVQAFRTTLQKYSNTVDASLAQIQGVPAPPEAQPPATTPPPSQNTQQ